MKSSILYLANGEQRGITPADGRCFTLDELSQHLEAKPIGLRMEESDTALVSSVGVRHPLNETATEVLQHWMGPYCEVFGNAIHCPLALLPPEVFHHG